MEAKGCGNRSRNTTLAHRGLSEYCGLLPSRDEEEDHISVKAQRLIALSNQLGGGLKDDVRRSVSGLQANPRDSITGLFLSSLETAFRDLTCSFFAPY